MCGIIGVISDDGSPVFRELANGAHFLQHRGPAYAGLFVSDPARRECELVKGEGLADDIFKRLDELEGDVGLAHTRYKTIGAGGRENAQPFFDPYSGIALAHNGHITNTEQIARQLADAGQRLRADCDAESLLRVLALWFEHHRRAALGAPEPEIMFRAIGEVLDRVTGAYSVVVATREGLYAFRDPNGFRPMVFGTRERGDGRLLMVASETIALEQNGYGVEEEIPGGWAMFVDRHLERTTIQIAPADPRPCAFELIYFADVDSTMFGERIRTFRWRAGKALALYVAELDPELVRSIDLVVPIPHSPIPGAEAFAQTLEKTFDDLALQYATPVSKYRYGGRVFMEETQAARDEAAMLDFRVDVKAVQGKRVFLVDDSIVRGTNARRIVTAMRRAGAVSVHLGVLWPMVIDSCFQGINTPTRMELIGSRLNGDEAAICRELGLDGLFYLPVAVFRERVIKNAPACMACATGQRAVKFEFPGSVIPSMAG